LEEKRAQNRVKSIRAIVGRVWIFTAIINSKLRGGQSNVEYLSKTAKELIKEVGDFL